MAEPQDISELTGPVTTPLVSVIIPVYNAGDHLRPCIDSAFAQEDALVRLVGSIDTGQGEGPRPSTGSEVLEVIAIDDGSTDGSSETLDALAAERPELHVIHQANSGGPGGPRNAGLDHARGQFVFFLDADDELAPCALADLVAMAQQADSDVVLGKMAGLNGRYVAQSMFQATTPCADLVADRIFYTLGPESLIRRELIERLGLRFDVGVKIGEDQPFMARCFLNARAVSVCADRAYLYVRAREDSGNVTSAHRCPAEHLELFERLVAAIIAETEPGALRDGVMRRPLRRSVTRSVGRILGESPRAEQLRTAAVLRELLAPVWNEATIAHLDPMPRTKLSLIMAGQDDAFCELLAWEVSSPRRRITHDGEHLRWNVPAQLADQLGDSAERAPDLEQEVRLTDLLLEGPAVRVQATALVPRCAVPLRQTLLRLSRRGSDEVIDVQPLRTRGLDVKAGAGTEITAEVDTAALAEGIWDLWILQRLGSEEAITRLGAERDEHVSLHTRYLPHGAGRVYATKDFDNLSIEIGSQASRKARGEVLSLWGENATTALVRLAAPGPVRIQARLLPAEITAFSAAKKAPAVTLPQRELDAGDVDLVAVSLSIPPSAEGHSLWLSLVDEHGERPLRFAPGLTPCPLPEGQNLVVAENRLEVRA